MKTLFQLVATMALFLTVNTAMAQPRGGGFSAENIEGRIEKQVEKYAEELQLDDLQTALLRSNLTDFANKQVEVFQGEGTREEKRATMQELREQQRTELAEFLSEDQMATLKELQKKERKKRRGMRQNRQRPQ